MGACAFGGEEAGAPVQPFFNALVFVGFAVAIKPSPADIARVDDLFASVSAQRTPLGATPVMS
jgi:hypothetical protein